MRLVTLVKASFVIVLLLVAGCATLKNGSYCQISEPPFRWKNLAEYDATPEAPRLRLMRDNEKYETLCANSR